MVNQSLVELFRNAIDNISTPVPLFNLSSLTFGDHIPLQKISAKRNEETLQLIALHGSFLANGTATEVTGAEPSHIMDDIKVTGISGDKEKVILMIDNVKAFKELVLNMVDKVAFDWNEDTLATDPSSVTYDFYAIIPVNGREMEEIYLDIDIGTYAKVYSADIVSAMTLKGYAYYSPVETPLYSIFVNSNTFTGTGSSDLTIPKDFNGGFLEFVDIIGDGTIVIDDIDFKDSNGATLISGKYTEHYSFQNQMANRTISTYTLVIGRVNSKKPFVHTDAPKIDISTAGTLYGAYIFKNESTAGSPVGNAQKNPTQNPTGQPERQPNRSETGYTVENLGKAVGNGVKKFTGRMRRV